MSSKKTIIDLLHEAANLDPNRTLYNFLTSNGRSRKNISPSGLVIQAQAFGNQLKYWHATSVNERVIIALPNGPEFVVSFFGCLFAGVIPVPFFPPRSRRDKGLSLLNVIKDSGATNVIVDTQTHARVLNSNYVDEALPYLNLIDFSSLHGVAVSNQAPVARTPTDIAYLQYTSGTTGQPKGVMITHDNVICNLSQMQNAYRIGENWKGVSWLPFHHDMGLVGCVLAPIYSSGQYAFIPPSAFARSPLRWLRTISQLRANITAAPNFAYLACANAKSNGENDPIDLSSLTCAIIGAEHIRASTLELFSVRFASSGFRARAFRPSYGLAENTVHVTSSLSNEVCIGRMPQHWRTNSLGKEHETTALVGCGVPPEGTVIEIIDPQSCRKVPSGVVGEIWVRGPSVAKGYWGRPRETAETFGAHVVGNDSQDYLRTGDLGYVRDGNLFLVGRSKELLVVRGVNFSPTELEEFVRQVDQRLYNSMNAIFSFGEKDDGRIIVAQEVAEYEMDALTAVSQTIRLALSERFGLRVNSIVYLKPGSLPRTASGKIQRRRCTDYYRSGMWDPIVVFEDQSPTSEELKNKREAVLDLSAGDISKAIGVVKRIIRDEINWKGAELEDDTLLSDLGLGSFDLLKLSGHLAELTGQNLSPNVIYDYPSIRSIASYLCGYSRNVRVRSVPLSHTEDIAIVGIACRLPGGSNSPEILWSNLTEGFIVEPQTVSLRESIDPFRRHIAGNLDSRHSACSGVYIDGIDQFDAKFFNISAQEAKHIDPQQRILLEIAYEAFADAGIKRSELKGSPTGVFIGASSPDYGSSMLTIRHRSSVYSVTGAAASINANRISYYFDLKGPSLVVDTACSSSATAVHLAVQSLNAGDSEVAIAGGVNLLLASTTTAQLLETGILSPDGYCRTFDDNANGYVRAEGAALVVLKPLSKAIADNDRIYSIIRSTFMNSDGTTAGIMAPSPNAQESLLRSAYEKTEISASEVQYIEAHGTGTYLGDPIEANVIGSVLSENRRSSDPCYIGSIKSNFGHTEAAAGVVGLIKIALSLFHNQIPPNRNYEKPNRLIDFNQLKLQVASRCHAYKVNEGGRQPIASVSSFGFGGTNVHAILQRYEPPEVADCEPNSSEVRPLLLPISGVDAPAFNQTITDISRTLARGICSPRQLCYTQGARREHWPLRSAIVAKDKEDLERKLKGLKHPTLEADRARKVAFVFSGQNNDWLPASRVLYHHERAFRVAYDDCKRHLIEAGVHPKFYDLIDDQTQVSQLSPGLSQAGNFAYQVSLSALWRSWGITPSGVLGHSIGEISSAHYSGALSMGDASEIIYQRSRALSATSGSGAMAALRLDWRDAESLIAPHEPAVSIAAINSPAVTIISGDRELVLRIVTSARRQKTAATMLDAQFAFHSSHMDDAVQILEKALPRIVGAETEVDIYSSVYGKSIQSQHLTTNYWAHHLRDPVMFSSALRSSVEDGYNTFVEISPRPTLRSDISISVSGEIENCVTIIGTPTDGNDYHEVALQGLAQAFECGLEPNFSALYDPAPSPSTLVPYPWKKQSYWYLCGSDYKNKQTLLSARTRAHPFIDRNIDMPNGHHIFEFDLAPDALPFLSDHKVLGSVVFPATAYIEMVIACWQNLSSIKGLVVELGNIRIEKALFLDSASSTTIQLEIERQDKKSYRFFIRSRHDKDWVNHIGGNINCDVRSDALENVDVAEIPNTAVAVDQGSFYDAVTALGNEYGPSFRCVNNLLVSKLFCRAWIRDVERRNALESSFSYHPALFDALLHSSAALFALRSEVANGCFMPISIGRVRVMVANLEGPFEVNSQLVESWSEDGQYVIYATVSDGNGKVVAEIKDLTFQVLGEPIERRHANFLYANWVKSEESTDARLPSTIGSDLSYIVFCDQQGIGELVADRLEAKGFTCARILAGSHFVRIDTLRYQANPASAVEVKNALADCREHVGRNAGIVHAWSVDLVDSDWHQPAPIDDVICRCLRPAILCASEPAPDRQPVWFITQGGQDSNGVGEDGISSGLWQSTLWGMARSFFIELPELQGGIIDIAPDLGEVVASESILHEIILGSADQVLITNEGRHTLQFGTSPFSETSDDDFCECNPNSSYFITGGLGALGGLAAQKLVDHGAKHLVLVGRSHLPARSEWHQNSLDLPIRAKCDLILALEEQGVKIRYFALDIGDPGTVAEILSVLQKEGWPPVRGILHAAGAVEHGPLSQATECALNNVIHPKLSGAWELYRNFHDQRLEFFICYSSLSSIVGTPLVGPYAAANAFLDQLATAGRKRSTALTSVSWGPWSGFGGMGNAWLRFESKAKQLSKVVGIQPDEGSEMLWRILRSKPSHVIVLPTTLEEWLRAHPLIAQSSQFETVNTSQIDTKVVPIKSTEMGVDSTIDTLTIEQYITKQICVLYGFSPNGISADSSITALGLDSLMVIELRNNLSREFGVNVSLADLFHGKTIRHIVQCVSNELEDAAASASMPHTIRSNQSNAIKGGERVFRLSSQQESFWFLYNLAPDSSAYNVALPLRLRQQVDHTVVEMAFSRILEKHRTLSARYFSHDGISLQEWGSNWVTDFQVVDCTKHSGSASCDIINQAVALPFRLSEAHVTRCCLLRLGPADYMILIVAHHIALDAMSLQRIAEDFFDELLVEKPENVIIERGPQSDYRDFINWQSNYMASEQAKKAKRYWHNYLPEESSPVEIRTDYSRFAIKTYNGASRNDDLGSDLSDNIRRFCESNNFTPFVFLLAGFQTLIFRRTEQDDFIIGTPIAGRPESRFADVVGPFTNMVPMRSHFDGSEIFETVVANTQEDLWNAIEFQHYPLFNIVGENLVGRDPSRNPLFDICFATEKTLSTRKVVDDGIARGSEVGLTRISQQEGQFDISIQVHEERGNFSLVTCFNRDLYKAETISLLISQYIKLLSYCIHKSSDQIRNISLMDEVSAAHLLELHGARQFRADRTLLDLFHYSNSRFTTNAAVLAGQDVITYSQLNKKVDLIATKILDLGISKGAAVGLHVDRSIDLIAGLLAIFRAGTVCVPLDPFYPDRRLAEIARDSELQLIVTDKDGGSNFVGCEDISLLPILSIVDDGAELGPFPEVRPEDAAYILYTSGSSGAPKGVMIEHGSYANTILCTNNVIGLTSSSRLLQFASIGFDAAFWDLGLALSTGALLVMTPPGGAIIGESLDLLIKRQAVTHANLPPSVARLSSPAELESLNCVTFGAELCPVDLVDTWIKHTRVINAYGPTEASIVATMHECSDIHYRSIPIGKPIDGVEIHILDSNLAQVPIGVVGQLYISGRALARGYLGQASLTEERFIQIPGHINTSNSRMYRTGDTGYWNADGELEYVDRVDDQVKVRGCRVELSEIDAVLMRHSLVENSCTVVQMTTAQPTVVSFVVPKHDHVLVRSDLRNYLRELLPQYMIPNSINPIYEIPLTSNGKVERKILQDAILEVQPDPTVFASAPISEAERILLSIWSNVLNAARMSTTDNVFDLGADSIICLHVVSLAAENGLVVTPSALYQHHTVAEQAKHCTFGARAHSKPENPSRYSNLTPIQQKFVDEYKHLEHLFCQHATLVYDNTIPISDIESTLRIVIDHHDCLKLTLDAAEKNLTFVETQRNNFQNSEDLLVRVVPSSDWQRVPTLDEQRKSHENDISINNGPLIRAAVIQSDIDSKNVLIVSIHHLVVDAVSWRIIINDLNTVLQSKLDQTEISLRTSATSFQEWTAALRSYSRTPQVTAELEDWLAELEAAHRDHPPQSSTVAIAPATLTGRLNQLSTKECLATVAGEPGVSLNDVLLAAFGNALSSSADICNFVVEVEGHGRHSMDPNFDLSRTVGWFTSAWPMHLEVASEQSDRWVILDSIRLKMRTAKFGGLHYGLLRYVNPETRKKFDGVGCPAFRFNYLGHFDYLDGGPLRQVSTEFENTSQTALTNDACLLEFVCYVKDQKINWKIVYSSQHISDEIVSTLSAEFENSLSNISELAARRLTVSSPDWCAISNQSDARTFRGSVHAEETIHGVCYEHEVYELTASTNDQLADYLTSAALHPIVTFVEEKKIWTNGGYVYDESIKAEKFFGDALAFLKRSTEESQFWLHLFYRKGELTPCAVQCVLRGKVMLVTEELLSLVSEIDGNVLQLEWGFYDEKARPQFPVLLKKCIVPHLQQELSQPLECYKLVGKSAHYNTVETSRRLLGEPVATYFHRGFQPPRMGYVFFSGIEEGLRALDLFE